MLTWKKVVVTVRPNIGAVMPIYMCNYYQWLIDFVVMIVDSENPSDSQPQYVCNTDQSV